jgi:4-hydroxy-3-methylbut-2-enyl diphosphate reductase
MRVSVAKALGTCFGVQDAIDLALDESFRENLTIIGELVHNPQVVKRLRDRGVKLVRSLDEPIDTPNVMITAHGAPSSIRQRAESMGFKVFDASCPLVLRVHKAVAEFLRDGFHPVVIGQSDHVEVRGITGDLADFTIILDATEIDKLIGKDKIGIVSQSTQPIDKVENLVSLIRAAFPDAEVRSRDTVCKPTKDRQVAVRELAAEVDLMIVIGGYNSSNTKKLKLVCDEMGVEAYHISDAQELRSEWFEGHEHVGITAGTSTPHEVIAELYEVIINMPEVDIAACSGLPERETFHDDY